MPIHKIEVSEYECMHCGHKWINRINGKDGDVPIKCAKCKRKYWNGWDQEYPKGNPITPKERSLRMRLHKFEGTLNRALGHGTQYRPNELCNKFLDLNPRPTMQELYKALYPLGWNPRSTKYKNYVPDPEKSGELKYDKSRWSVPDIHDPKWKYNSDPDFVSDYDKLLNDESLKRKEFMKKVIISRGEKVPNEKTSNSFACSDSKGLSEL